MERLRDTRDYGDSTENRKYKRLGSHFVTVRIMGVTYRLLQ